MASLVEICSAALMMVGSDAVTDLEDGSTRANLCNAFYPLARDAVLRAYPWSCARITATINQEVWTSEDNDIWEYRYALPTDPYCLWVPKSLNEDLDYEIRARKLYCNEDTAIILNYISRITSTAYFDSLLVETIIIRLAHNLALPITGIASLSKEMFALYLEKIREARTQDAMEEGTLKVYSANVLTEVR